MLAANAVRRSGRTTSILQRALGQVEFLETRRFLSAAGELDPSFGIDGTAIFGQEPLTLADSARQADGKFVVAAVRTPLDGSDRTGFVQRFNVNGSLDTSFSGGKVVIDVLPDRDEKISNILIQPNGKLVLAGTALGDESLNGTAPAFIVRLNANGTLDTTFGVAGVFKSDAVQIDQFLSDPHETEQLLLFPDGKLLFAGVIRQTSPDLDYDIVLLRTTANGHVDTTFGGGDGIATVDQGALEYLVSLSLLPGGDIHLVGGQAQASVEPRNFYLRLNDDGSIDSAQPTVILSDTTIYSRVNDSLRLADGRIVVASRRSIGVGQPFLSYIGRFNTDGSVDTTFGDNGFTAVIPPGASSGTADGLELIARPDGSYIVAQSIARETNEEIDGITQLGAFDSQGDRITTFGAHGLMEVAQQSRAGGGNTDIDVDVLPSGGIVGAWVSGEPYGVAAFSLTASGAYDGSFGEGGIVEPPQGFDGQINDVAVLTSGKILAVGQVIIDAIPTMFVARLTAAGALDTTFDGDGMQTDFGPTYNNGTQIYVRSDGKYLVNTDRGIVRIGTDGFVDGTFGGGDGIINVVAKNFAVQNDGKIVFVAGDTVRRYTPGGGRDNSWTAIDLNAQLALEAFTAGNLAVAPDGKVVVSGIGYRLGETTFPDTVITRLKNNGTIDAGFGGGDGFTAIDVAGFEFGGPLVVRPNGQIVAVSDVEDGFMALAQLNSNGTLDSSFGPATSGDGFYVDLKGRTGEPRDLVLLPDGDVILGVVNRSPGDGPDFGALRFNNDGSPDRSFSFDGVSFHDLVDSRNSADEMTGVRVAPNGDVYAFGSSSLGGGQRLAISRLDGANTEAIAYYPNDRGVRLYGTGSGDNITLNVSGLNFIGKVNSTTRTIALSDIDHIEAWGGTGNDRLVVGAATLATALFGGGGNDLLSGGDQADSLFGEAGNDTLNGAGGGDEVHGGSGSDSLTGGAGDDKLYGEKDGDILIGNAGADLLVGSTGNDALNGGTGNDRLDGGTGRDAMFGQDGNDFIFSRDGERDTVNGGTGDDTADADAIDLVSGV